jgi:hypothetical protein
MSVKTRNRSKRKMTLIRKKMKAFRVRELKLICRLDPDYFQASKEKFMGEIKC